MNTPTHIVHTVGLGIGRRPEISRIVEDGLHLFNCAGAGTFSRITKRHIIHHEWKLLHEGSKASCREFIASYEV